VKKVLLITLLILLPVWIFNIYENVRRENRARQNRTIETIPIIPIVRATTTLEIIQVTKTPTTTTTTTKKNLQPKASVVVVTPAIPTFTMIQTPPEPAPDFEAINKFVRTTIVNILCTVNDDSLSPISGTGVVVGPNGIVLTNAHVAQYFLLRNLYRKDYVQCILRTGSPAYPTYHAELAYISPAWVSENKALLKSSSEKGTGEDDFAFLRIIDRIDSSPLMTLPYVTVNVDENPKIGTPVVLVSYPAGFLGGLTISQNLNITSAITVIQNLFTFQLGTIDVIGVGGTVVSQNGASGGAVVDGKSNLIGVIATRSSGDTTSSRELDAITLKYIDKRMQDETNLTLSQFLSQNISDFAKRFQADTAPTLTKIITDELTKTN